MQPREYKKEPVRKANPPSTVSGLTTIFNPEADPLARLRQSLLSNVPIHQPAGIETDAPVPARPGLAPTGLPGLGLRHFASEANHANVLAEGLVPGKGKGIGRPDGTGGDTEHFYAVDLEQRGAAGAVSQDLSGARAVGVVGRDSGMEDTNYRWDAGARLFSGIAPPIRDRQDHPNQDTFSFPLPLTPRSTDAAPPARQPAACAAGT